MTIRDSFDLTTKEIDIERVNHDFVSDSLSIAII